MNDSKQRQSAFSMADVSGKRATQRKAVATGRISVGREAFELLSNNALPKGDALAMGELAGLQAAKLTPLLLPLCHPIALSHAAIHTVLRPDTLAVDVYAVAEITERTGVEMEALTGVSVALLAIWDLVKPINPALEISNLRLLYKSGGKRGEWTHPDGLPPEAQALI